MVTAILETYLKAQFDILQNSLDRAREQYHNQDNTIAQLETLGKQVRSFTDWLKVRSKFG